MSRVPCCECGGFAELDEHGICAGCRRVESRITPEYQRREQYRAVCPMCGRGMCWLGGLYECPWCGRSFVHPAYDHRNATKTPRLGLPDEVHRMTIREAVDLFGIPRTRAW